MICTQYSTPGMISSLLSFITTLAAGIKLSLVPRSTTRKTVEGTSKWNDLTNSSVERFNGFSSLQNGATCKDHDCTADNVPIGTMLQKDSTSLIVLRYRLLNPKPKTDKTVIRSVQWSSNEHILMSGAFVITRSSLLKAMWVGQRTNFSQPAILRKYRALYPCRSVG